jgi:hypothetical protein
MQTSADCVFAIDLRVRHFGFVLIERPNILLDWGVSGYHSSPSEALTRKITQVAEQFSPSIILCRRTIENGPLLDVLERQALEHSIPVHFVTPHRLHNYFAQCGRPNKYAVAELVAREFPELAWRLPKKRKAWQSERLVQAIFDAAALVVFHSAEKT